MNMIIMNTTPLITRASRFFHRVTMYPKVLVTLGLLGLVTMGAVGPYLVPSTTATAVIPAIHTALAYRGQVKETFGLQDPIVVAVVNEGPHGVFTPHSLDLVHWLTAQLSEVNHVDPERIISLASENDIIGTVDGLVVEPFVDQPPQTQAQADRVRAAVMGVPLYRGSLIAPDGSATLIVAELLDPTRAEAVYHDLLALIADAPVAQETLQIKVTGSPFVMTTYDPLVTAMTRSAHATVARVMNQSTHHRAPLF